MTGAVIVGKYERKRKNEALEWEVIHGEVDKRLSPKKVFINAYNREGTIETWKDREEWMDIVFRLDKEGAQGKGTATGFLRSKEETSYWKLEVGWSEVLLDVGSTEVETLSKLWNHCQLHPDHLVSYIRSHGGGEVGGHPWTEWRSALDVAVSDTCANMQFTCNVCQKKFFPLPTPRVAENMWMAKCDYVRNLHDPKVYAQTITTHSEPANFVKNDDQCRHIGAVDRWIVSHPEAKPCDVSGGILSPHIQQSFASIDSSPLHPFLHYDHDGDDAICGAKALDHFKLRLDEYSKSYPSINRPPPNWWGWDFFGVTSSKENYTSKEEREFWCKHQWEGNAQISTRLQNKNIILVISHCNHNLDWLDKYTDGISIAKTFVISKCGAVKGLGPKFADAKTIKLLNMGRCDHSWAHFMSREFNEVMERNSDVVVFLKDTFGSNTHQHHMHLRSFRDLIESASGYGFGCGYRPINGRSLWFNSGLLLGFTNDCHKPCPNKYIAKLISVLMTEKPYTQADPRPLGRWIEKELKFTLPPNATPVCFGGSFAVRSDKIRARKEILELILEALSHSNNSEEGHYVERIWSALFYDTEPAQALDIRDRGGKNGRGADLVTQSRRNLDALVLQYQIRLLHNHRNNSRP